MYPTVEQLENYAALAIQVGVNVQEGQTVFVTAPISAADLVRQIAAKAYDVGAKNVHIEWNDDECTRIKYKKAPMEAFSEYPMWRAKGMEELCENGACFISIYSPNPDLLQGVESARIATANKTSATALSKYRSYLMSHKNSWTLISYATNEWAAKVFPDRSQEEAVQALWERIIDATRIDREDPIAAWKEHNAKLAQTVELLNNKRYKELHYTAEGTDLTVQLPEKHVWLGGAKANAKGDLFNPNMPTEEVFTMPHKDGVNGTVRSTKPLNYSGQIINNFSITFKDGVAVDFSAEEGYEALERLLNTDEGARRLGEVALVPFDSPISNSNVVFYNTLFDENASCHLAFGQAYSVNIEGGTEMSDEELAERGVNKSLTHVDFMIGSADMNIDGVTQDGKREPIFRNGNWAI
ncbi:aminopeptidase [Paenibacillus cremeus]|uniref:Aminopeptidase n=1 Tax=Paenibacillus cremeus TaxID=2163881 RepID=A0A559K8K0_9BACL|nr:aminopeptidase [Paenibacillus cremeus]TVY08447.1 aminopeptidase [Paenibacillus cremeus]